MDQGLATRVWEAIDAIDDELVERGFRITRSGLDSFGGRFLIGFDDDAPDIPVALVDAVATVTRTEVDFGRGSGAIAIASLGDKPPRLPLRPVSIEELLSIREHGERDAAVVVRTATDDDWPQIWPIVAAVLADGRTYCQPRNYGRDLFAADARTWWMGKPGGAVFVAADVHGRVLGTAELHPNLPGPGAHVANAGFMVEPECGGRGIGRLLAEHVLAAAREAGYRAMQFNAVVETNTGAIALWQSLGFEILATVPESFDHPDLGFVGMHVMYRSL